jgi:DNA (cytosine-5)-methyltransferase 1
MSRRPTVIDLFCGAGGLSLGFHAAGCRVLAGVDLDPVAARTFADNLAALQPGQPPVVLSGPEADMETADLSALTPGAAPDIVVGGPPCQAYSRVGRGKLASLSEQGFADDPRNRLYLRFLAAVGLWRPRAVVMENVPGMQTVRGINHAGLVTRELARLGYRAGHVLLNAVWYGAPQFRERLFFIGLRADLGVAPAAPTATHRADQPEGYRRPLRDRTATLPFAGEDGLTEGELAVPCVSAPLPAVTVEEALRDLPPLTEHLTCAPLPRGDFRRHRAYARPADTSYARLMRCWPGLPDPGGISDHVTRRTPRDHETFRRMRPGDRYPEALRIAVARFDEEMARLRSLGEAPEPETPAWERLRQRYVPPYPADTFADRWRKLSASQPSRTIPAHLGRDSYSHIHHDDDQARTISVREAARLQSFPDAFVFRGNMGDCFREIGNAVPPLLAWAIAASLLGLLGLEAARAPFLAELSPVGYN